MTKVSKSSAATIESLELRRVEQEKQIAVLRAKHTQAIIDGEEFDAAPIRAAEDELTAIVSAQNTLVELQKEYERREAEELERLSDEEKRKRIADQLGKMEADWLAEVEAAEEAARAFAAAYSRAEAVRSRLHVALMSQGTSSLGLVSDGFETRISAALAAILSKLVGKSSFGQIKLGPLTREANAPWSFAERPVSVDVERTIASLRSMDEEAA